MVVIFEAMATSRDWKRTLQIYLVIRLLHGRTVHGAMSSSGARMSTKPRSGFRLRVLYVARFGPADLEGSSLYRGTGPTMPALISTALQNLCTCKSIKKSSAPSEK